MTEDDIFVARGVQNVGIYHASSRRQARAILLAHYYTDDTSGLLDYYGRPRGYVRTVYKDLHSAVVHVRTFISLR